MKTSFKQGLADFGLLILRLGVGIDMTYHGSQKLFGEPNGGWFTTDPKTGAIPDAAQLAPTLKERIGGFARFLDSLGVPYPEVNAWVAAITEFGGGLLIVFGLFTRFGALGVAIAMGVAAFLVHLGSWDARSNGMELPVMLMCMALALVFTGPGRISLDALFFRAKDPYAD